MNRSARGLSVKRFDLSDGLDTTLYKTIEGKRKDVINKCSILS